jgi:photosystem II stability/assembly factor-like uncharacterized protein
MAIRRWAADAANLIISFFSLVTGTLVHAQDGVTLMHVHGLGFSADGAELVIPSHHGLAVYRNGQWAKAPGPQHDYMGFVGTKRGYYTSGHPAPGSGLINPFGLMRSDDNGKTWTKLGLEGQSDFHLLAASFATNAVYVYNTEPNSLMDRAGLYSSLNDGKTWRRAQAVGLEGPLLSLAVHPTDPNVVAAGTRAGLFISRDAGGHFSRQFGNAQVPGLTFDQDGTTIWASSFDRSARLSKIDWKSGQKTERALPSLGDDAVAYIAQHPHDLNELAIATFARSVFLSRDGGMTWKQIADHGRTL